MLKQNKYFLFYPIVLFRKLISNFDCKMEQISLIWWKIDGQSCLYLTERDVAFNMFTALNSSLAPRAKSRASQARDKHIQRNMSPLPAQMRRPSTAPGMRTGVPRLMYPHQEEQYIKALVKSLQRWVKWQVSFYQIAGVFRLENLQLGDKLVVDIHATVILLVEIILSLESSAIPSLGCQTGIPALVWQKIQESLTQDNHNQKS